MDTLMREIRPDVVFHVAAQRDPGLAEVEVHRTVSTNVLGTRTVLTAAAEAGVPQVVCASTGKALRPYSPDMYTASKRAAEWVASGVAASSDMLVSAGRFTHVLDNSIIYKRLLSWADEPEDGVIRLHSPDIAFYVQSALESAQLLLLACLGSERARVPRPRHQRSRLAGQPDGPRARRAGPFGLADADLCQRLRPGVRGDPVPRALRPDDGG